MNKYISFGALAISIIALAFAVVGGNNQPQELGGGTRMINGLSTDSTSPSAGQVRTTTLAVTSTSVLSGDITLSGGAGALTLTTSNTATSTASIGCINTYATSTATRVHLVIGSGANATTSYDGTNAVGVVGWLYGACP